MAQGVDNQNCHEVTPEMIEAAAELIEASPWFEGGRVFAEMLALDVLRAAASTRRNTL